MWGTEFFSGSTSIQHLPTHDSPKSSYSNVTFHLISRSSSKSVCCVSIGQSSIIRMSDKGSGESRPKTLFSPRMCRTRRCFVQEGHNASAMYKHEAGMVVVNLSHTENCRY
jgi:hypothetical protein